jgi:hypothetical protein
VRREREEDGGGRREKGEGRGERGEDVRGRSGGKNEERTTTILLPSGSSSRPSHKKFKGLNWPENCEGGGKRRGGGEERRGLWEGGEERHTSFHNNLERRVLNELISKGERRRKGPK